MKLSVAIQAVKPLSLHREPDTGLWAAHGVRPSAPVEQWRYILAAWWRRSPSTISECGECGEIRFTGKRGSKKKCHMPRCDGRFEPLELDDAFTKPRPRRRRRDLRSVEP